MKREVKGLIFDLDGVIVSTEHNHFVAWKRTAEELGIAFTEKDNEKLKGLSRVDSLKTILAMENVLISEDEFQTLLDDKNKFYLESITELNRSNLLPGVLELLEKAKADGILLAVGSSSKNAPYIIKLLELNEFFTIIVDGNMVSDPKPHPEVFLNAAKGMNLNPADCIVFEDAESGVQAGLAGGFTTVGVGNPNLKTLVEEYYTDLREFNTKFYA
ncbi:MAG: beta-phosphoglucomutase [Flavobacteriia bacterium]